MNREKLFEYDKSLKIVSKQNVNCKIKGITTISYLKDDHLLFIKNDCLLEKFISLIETSQKKNICIITVDKLVSKLLNISNMEQIAFVATVEDINLSMSYISKPFYDEYISDFDDSIDGRENGFVKIGENAMIAPNVFLGKNVEIGNSVKIYAGAVILSGSKIGDYTEIFPNVTIYQNVEIKKHCRIHSGVVIGADGFGYNYSSGVHHKMWHTGGVIIGDDVEIGAGATVDAGTFSPTTIESGSKIDNIVQVAHNCNLGKGVIMCGQSGTAGSVTIGNYTVIGGKVGIAPNVELGDGCQVAGAAMVTKNWEDKSAIAGHPAKPIKEWFKENAWIRTNMKKK